VGVHVVSFWL